VEDVGVLEKEETGFVRGGSFKTYMRSKRGWRGQREVAKGKSCWGGERGRPLRDTSSGSSDPFAISIGDGRTIWGGTAEREKREGTME